MRSDVFMDYVNNLILFMIFSYPLFSLNYMYVYMYCYTVHTDHCALSENYIFTYPYSKCVPRGSFLCFIVLQY